MAVFAAVPQDCGSLPRVFKRHKKAGFGGYLQHWPCPKGSFNLPAS